MVCSQVYFQHSSHCVFSNVHQHRSGAPSNSELHCQEPETSEGNWLGNTAPDGHLWSSKGYACSGYANTTSPFKSSWIQRLIPSHNTREQPHPLDKHIRENHVIDGVQTNWKENADYLTVLGNRPDLPVYENSRRSMQNFFSSRQTYLGTNTPGCVQNGVNIAATSILFEVPETLPPEIHVPPKPLPVVESLLPECSKKVTESQTSTETNVPHILSRCTGFVIPMKQTVHYSADEKSRVSCSSIEGLNSDSVVCAAGDLIALKSLQLGKQRVDPSQPFSESPFDSLDAVTRSDMDPTFGGKDRRIGTDLRTHMNSTQTEDASITLRTESRYPNLHQDRASSVARSQYVENRLLDGYSIPMRAEGMESFQERFSQANLLASKADERLPLGFSMDRVMCSKTISKRNCWNPKDSYAHDGSEALHAREGSFDGGWCSIPNMEKDGPQQISILDSSHREANFAKEKAGISSSRYMIEQALGSSHGSHEEQGGTSRSFSFHFENRLAELDQAKVVTRKGQWPFGPSTLSSEDLDQSRWSEDNRARDLAEAIRLGLPPDSSSIFQEIGVCEVGNADINRSRCSPFFGSENLNKSTSRRIADNHDGLPYKAACIDIRGVLGEMNTQALPGSSVDEAGREEARSLLGGHKLSRLESSLRIEGMEGKELLYSLPSRTVGVSDWKAFKPSIKSSTYTCPPEGTQLDHADGNRVSVSNWKAFKPSIRSTRTCRPEHTPLNHADGNLCYSTGSIGSCSGAPANLCIEDPSTSVDARSRPITYEKPAALPSAALQNKLHSSSRLCAGSGVNTAPYDRESEGKKALGWEGPGSAVKQNIWLQRWFPMSSRKVQAVSMPSREGRILAGMTHARNNFEDYSTSQGSRESSYRFDLRPAKRICYEKRSGLQPELGNSIKIGSEAVGSEHYKKGVVSHFMKRFFTPTAAAMAIMGMMARKVHATQPQRRGLFGVWAANASAKKPSPAQPEVCKEFLTEKEFLQSAAKALSTPLDVNKRCR